MTKPIRLRLSRRKGFDLQAASRATNGLEAINVARPSKWGNPFKIGSRDPRTGGVMDASTAVERYCNALVLGWLSWNRRSTAIEQLRGKNLACWCLAGAPCHADVLLEMANR